MNRLLHDPQLIVLRQQLADLQPLMERGIVTHPASGRQYFTGYSYHTLYDWDQYFEALIQVYMGWPSDYIKNGVLIFLDQQRPDGSIPRSVPSNERHDPEHVKPFLAQVAWLVHRGYKETDWILAEPYFTRLQRYLDYWLVDMDANHNGLSEWMSAPHTGMDNQHERAGWWLDRFSEGVDLNSYLVRECRAFARLAEVGGKLPLAAHYRQLADERAERIRELCWEETDGFFYDHNARGGEDRRSKYAGWASAVNEDTGELIRVKSAAAFAVLWARVASAEQARRMIYDHLMNSREFWTPYPLSALARSERWYSRDWLPGDLGCNWRACTWVPANFIAYHGLRTYGYPELASLLAHNTVELVRRSGNREYYDTETGAGLGLDPFWGWSLLAHFLPYEELQEERIYDPGFIE